MSARPGAPGGARPDRRRSSGNRKRKDAREGDTPRKIEMRAAWVVSVIDDQPWLYGSYGKLSKMVRQQFGLNSLNAGDRAVTRAYEILDARLAKFKDSVGNYLLHVHRKTIEKGFREDGRLVTPAAKALAQLVGAEAPQGVHVSGGMASTLVMSADDRVLLESLKLTNAQRLAEIDRVERELAEEERSGAPAGGPDDHVDEPPDRSGGEVGEDDRNNRGDQNENRPE